MDPAMVASTRPVIRKETDILLAIFILFSGDSCETRDKGSDVRVKGYSLFVIAAEPRHYSPSPELSCSLLE